MVDVEDCITAAKSLASAPHHLVDEKRLIIRGGSSGGFTVLAALSTAADVTTFAAATSLYGISDLNKLAEFTHKFESQYMYNLLGGKPDEVPDVYHARSPIHHADNIVSPLLVSAQFSVPRSMCLYVPTRLTFCIPDSSRGARQSRSQRPGRGHLQEHTRSRRRSGV